MENLNRAESTNNTFALKGEKYVFEKLQELGFNPEWVAFGNRSSTADIMIGEKSIDVKISSRVKYYSYLKGAYRFNFHHHGKLQKGIDYFICVCAEDGLVYIFPSKLIRRPTMIISDKQISRRKREYFLENWDLLKEK